jgi:hypothetical protein
MYLSEKKYDGVDWIQLAQNRVQRLSVVNTILNFWFHKRRRIY